MTASRGAPLPPTRSELVREPLPEPLRAQLLDAVGQPVIATDRDGRIFYWNDAAERLYGWRREEVLGRPILEVTPSESLVSKASAIMERLGRGESFTGEFVVRKKDGTEFPVIVTNTPVMDAEGKVLAVLGVSSDLSDRKQLERQLLQSQRMEAVGRLAGGVAHDFNNVLTAIEGHLTFLGDALTPDDAAWRDVEGIRSAALRAARLTQQLLAFSRRQVFSAGTFDLRGLVGDNEDLIEVLVGRGVTIDLRLDDRPVLVHADRGQLEAVVMELVTNARDATEPGGKIVLEVSAVDLPQGSPERRPEMPLGRYGRIMVRDRGSGMPREVLERVFEPFFTTKPGWKSSGLGLSTAYGIVKQSGGFIYADSEPGKGSVVSVYLPEAETSPGSTSGSGA